MNEFILKHKFGSERVSIYILLYFKILVNSSFSLPSGENDKIICENEICVTCSIFYEFQQKSFENLTKKKIIVSKFSEHSKIARATDTCISAELNSAFFQYYPKNTPRPR